MLKQIPDLLSRELVAELKRIAAAAQFVDGRISNPHAKVKQNLQLHDEAAPDARRVAPGLAQTS